MEAAASAAFLVAGLGAVYVANNMEQVPDTKFVGGIPRGVEYRWKVKKNMEPMNVDNGQKLAVTPEKKAQLLSKISKQLSGSKRKYVAQRRDPRGVRQKLDFTPASGSVANTRRGGRRRPRGGIQLGARIRRRTSNYVRRYPIRAHRRMRRRRSGRRSSSNTRFH